MKNKNLHIIRKQLDAKLRKIKKLNIISQRPAKGWLYAIRTSLGLNVRQFAQLMGVDKSRISRMEKDETRGALTINSLRHAAEVLGCELTYALTPKESLEGFVQKRAENVVGQQLKRSSHTMALENQQLTEQEQKQLFLAKVEQLCKETPKHLWENYGNTH